ncbi:MAG: CotH kinase family protein [Pseudomonadota bacterium]|nr:CotH kinase family protein [Pseudomonadota bacterium]
MLLSLALACAPTGLEVGGGPADRPPREDTDPADTDATDTDPTDTDPADTGSETGFEHVPDDTGTTDTGEKIEADDTRIFNLDAIHTVAITLPADGRRALAADPYTYVAADVSFDGASFPNVGVRIKGRLGSYRTLDQKAGFKVDFLEFGEATKLEGLEKINLNNMVQDCAKVHEYAAYGVSRMLDIPAPRVAYARVTVDGEDFGVYSLVEDYDDEFLQKNFSDPTGNLYDGDYYLWPNGSYTLVDFTDAGQPYFQLDEGADVALSDVSAITDALRAGGTFVDSLDTLVDRDQHAAFIAFSAWIGHYNSYTYYSNNYRVYFDPARGGKAVFLPWDPDWAFYSATAVTAFYGAISGKCYADPACNARIHTTLDTLDTTLPGSALESEIQAAITLLQPSLMEDPRMEDTMRAVRVCQADLFSWFDRRGGELDAAGL